jgi:hypothetical protein
VERHPALGDFSPLPRRAGAFHRGQKTTHAAAAINISRLNSITYKTSKTGTIPAQV